jgi:predicted nuclease of predicted toxin-antitoxin system
MRLLADENIHGGIVQWLRSQGHDVLWATETLQGVDDAILWQTAQQHERVLVTADLDFGELVFRERLTSHGGVLLRMEDLTVQERLARLHVAWESLEAHAIGQFVVLTAERIRVRPLTR